MRYLLLLFIVTALSFSTFSASKVEAADVTAALARMDAIIKEIQLLRTEFASLAQTSSQVPSGAVLGASAKASLTQSLELGVTNSDIKKIQKLLATDPLIYPYGVSSGFFGPKTEEGIKNFQARFNLDPVGEIGPATKSLLELFFAAYPDDIYPTDVLKKKPQVLGASTSVTPAPVTTIPSVTSGKSVESITAFLQKGGKSKVTITYTNGTDEKATIAGDTKLQVVDSIAIKLGQTRAQILAKIEFTSGDDNEDSNDDEDEDEFDIDIEIDGDEVTLTFEYDGDDYEVESDSTDEDDVMDEVADELNEDVDDLDGDLVDAIEEALDEALNNEDEDGEEIDSIEASVKNGEAHIVVEYGNGDDEEFDVEEDKEEKIIEEVADELNIDAGDVEDVIEFEYQPVDSIEVIIQDGKAVADVEFEDGTTKRIRIDSEDEDDIIEAIAEELDEDEENVADWTNF